MLGIYLRTVYGRVNGVAQLVCGTALQPGGSQDRFPIM
jgi:hypothetical protein